VAPARRLGSSLLPPISAPPLDATLLPVSCLDAMLFSSISGRPASFTPRLVAAPHGSPLHVWFMPAVILSNTIVRINISPALLGDAAHSATPVSCQPCDAIYRSLYPRRVSPALDGRRSSAQDGTARAGGSGHIASNDAFSGNALKRTTYRAGWAKAWCGMRFRGLRRTRSAVPRLQLAADDLVAAWDATVPTNISRRRQAGLELARAGMGDARGRTPLDNNVCWRWRSGNDAAGGNGRAENVTAARWKSTIRLRIGHGVAAERWRIKQ